jgi:hypothetical protein
VCCAQAVNILVPLSYVGGQLSALAQQGSSATDAKINIQLLPMMQLSKAATQLNVKDSPADLAQWESVSGILVNPESHAILAEQKQLADISKAVQQQEGYKWDDLLRAAGSQPEQITTLPLDNAMLLLFYRADVLEQHQMLPPSSWDQLLKLAAALNGTDMNGDGTSDHAVCINLAAGVCRLAVECFGLVVKHTNSFCWHPTHDVFKSGLSVRPLRTLTRGMWAAGCKLWYWYSAILAPMVQYQGTAQGMLFEASDMAPLINTDAGAAALALLRGLHPLTTSDDSCSAVESAFIRGECAFSLGWVSQFKVRDCLSEIIVQIGTMCLHLLHACCDQH